MAAQYLAHERVEAMGRRNLRGGAPAGDSLPIEAERATKHETLRTVVREAIKMFTAKGLVGSRPRRGTHVEPEAQ